MRPQSRVHLTVSAQTAGVLEGFAALFAHIRPLTCVLPQVVLVVGAPFESERAMRALKSPNTRVYLGKVTENNKFLAILFFKYKILTH